MIIRNSIVAGLVASFGLLAVYFAVISAISGWDFARSQFDTFWYFITALAAGFGIQISLYRYLRSKVRRGGGHAKGVLAVTGTNSTVAMISCCAHYLANILPIVGVTGFLALVGQYQIELFWVGLASNLLGIAYILRKIIKFSRI